MLKELLLTVSIIMLLTTPIRIHGASILKCDSLVCPDSAVSCEMEKKSIDENKNIAVVRKCIGSDGQTVSESTNTIPNPNPGSIVNSMMMAYRGNERTISIPQVPTNLNEKVSNAMKQGKDKLDAMIETMNKNMQETMENISEKISG